jgi:hypothetical protein
MRYPLAKPVCHDPQTPPLLFDAALRTSCVLTGCVAAPASMACALVYLLCCRARCQPKVLASALAFFPPKPPSYELHPDPEDLEKGSARAKAQLMRMVLQEGVSVLRFPSTAGASLCCTVRNKRGSNVPVFLYRYPGSPVTILFSHGNATDCGLMRDSYIDLCLNSRVNVVAYEYSGYGPGVGEVMPTDSSCCADIEAVYDFLLGTQDERWRVPSPAQLILYGQSVGSGPTCYLASRRPVRGVVLHSPITSGLRVVTDNRCLACCDIFPNLDRVHRIAAHCEGVLVLHGLADAEVPPRHGQMLVDSFRAAIGQRPSVPTARALGLGASFATVHKWFPERAGHNDVVEKYPVEYHQALRAFLFDLYGGRGAGAGAPPPAGSGAAVAAAGSGAVAETDYRVDVAASSPAAVDVVDARRRRGPPEGAVTPASVTGAAKVASVIVTTAARADCAGRAADAAACAAHVAAMVDAPVLRPSQLSLAGERLWAAATATAVGAAGSAQAGITAPQGSGDVLSAPGAVGAAAAGGFATSPLHAVPLGALGADKSEARSGGSSSTGRRSSRYQREAAAVAASLSSCSPSPVYGLHRAGSSLEGAAGVGSRGVPAPKFTAGAASALAPASHSAARTTRPHLGESGHAPTAAAVLRFDPHRAHAAGEEMEAAPP